MGSRPTCFLGAQMNRKSLCVVSLSGLILSLVGCGGATETPQKRINVVPRPTAALTSVAEEWAIRFEDRPSGAAGYELSAIIGCGCAVLDVPFYSEDLTLAF